MRWGQSLEYASVGRGGQGRASRYLCKKGKDASRGFDLDQSLAVFGWADAQTLRLFWVEDDLVSPGPDLFEIGIAVGLAS